MKRIAIGIIVLCSIIGVVVFMVSKQTEAPVSKNLNSAIATSGEIKKGMVLKQIHEIQTGDSKVVIGNKDETGPMKPKITLSKWNDEARFSISYPQSDNSLSSSGLTRGSNAPSIPEDNKIVWSQPSQDVYFKKVVDSNPTQKEPNDKFEFDILLKEKPSSNVFTYNIDTNNLDFLYQPELTAKEKLEGYSRPENVIGSYAVYYKGGKTGDFTQMGGNNYKTGKAFHIYRPQIIDAKGNKTWGTLDVILANGASSTTGVVRPESDSGVVESDSTPQNDGVSKLTVTVDPSFLASASYPVTVDPTFGYTTAGASNVAMNNSIRGSYWSMPENGTPTSISVYQYVSGFTCFTGDTLITMADGSYKQIKDVKVGDKVRSYNLNSKSIVNEAVVKTFYHPAKEMTEGYLKIETNNGKTVRITPNHSVYVNGSWQEARMLKKGDILISDQNHEIRVSSVKLINTQLASYNLQISNSHVYFANFLVHNVSVSFLEGTKVEMANSERKDIEKVAVGDFVKSYNTKKKQVETVPVTQIASDRDENYLVITDVLGNILQVTGGHPLFSDGRWKLARQLKVGDHLTTENQEVEVESIEKIERKITGYNIQNKNHNYFANGKLVDDESKITKSGEIAEGSNILTPSGYKKVEDLMSGEQVVTYNITTHAIEYGAITSFQIGIDEQPLITVNNILSLTPETSIYTSLGEKKVKDLEIGDELINSSGESIKVFSLLCGQKKDVYSLGISGNHNVFVNGYLAHNGTGYTKAAIYQQSDNSQIITSAENTYTTTGITTSWQTFTITGSPNLTVSDNYWLYAWGSLGSLTLLNLYYDSGGNGVNKAVAYGAWPNPVTGQTTDNNKYSIYATYTTAATPTPTPTPYKTNLKGNINLRGNMNFR